MLHRNLHVISRSVGSCVRVRPVVKSIFPCLGRGKQVSAVRHATSISTTPQTEKLAYPARLLVYHAGTGRVVFLGVNKVLTIIVFGIAAGVVAPMYYGDTDQPWYLIPTVVIGGAIPMLWVSRNTRPFTVYVHVLLPKTARQSRQALAKYLNNKQHEIELEMTTLNFIGLSRQTRMRLGELRTKPESLADIANLVHQSTKRGRTSLSAIRGPPRKFFVGSTVNKAPEPRLWNALLERIRKENPKERA